MCVNIPMKIEIIFQDTHSFINMIRMTLFIHDIKLKHM